MTQIKEFLRRGLFTVIVLCSAAACSNNDENEDTNYTLDGIPVSYTHLTLPTILRV